jgi:hypothetical protein
MAGMEILVARLHFLLRSLAEEQKKPRIMLKRR